MTYSLKKTHSTSASRAPGPATGVVSGRVYFAGSAPVDAGAADGGGAEDDASAPGPVVPPATTQFRRVDPARGPRCADSGSVRGTRDPGPTGAQEEGSHGTVGSRGAPVERGGWTEARGREGP